MHWPTGQSILEGIVGLDEILILIGDERFLILILFGGGPVLKLSGEFFSNSFGWLLRDLTDAMESVICPAKGPEAPEDSIKSSKLGSIESSHSRLVDETSVKSSWLIAIVGDTTGFWTSSDSATLNETLIFMLSATFLNSSTSSGSKSTRPQ